MTYTSIYDKLKPVSNGAANNDTIAVTNIKPWAPAPSVDIQDAIVGANEAVTPSNKAAPPKVAPAYTDVSSPYTQTQANAANQRATEATKNQSYTPITSQFAGAGAYTQANASRAGQVLQQLYSGNASTKTTKGEAGLSAQLAAQGGAAFGEDKEKELNDNAQKAYEATNPDKVAEKLLGNMNGIPLGTDLNYQAQSMIAPDVYAAERMDRQARVNENLRTGNSEALAAEGSMSNLNPVYKEGIKSYITDTSKAALESAKGTLQKNKEAAEGAVAAAKADVEKSNTDASTISAVNNMERALGKKLTAAGGSASPEYVAQLRKDAEAEALRTYTQLSAKIKDDFGVSLKQKPDGSYYVDLAKLHPGNRVLFTPGGKLAKRIDKINELNRLAKGSKEYSGYMDESLAAQGQAQSELDKIASQYGRFS